MYSIMNNKKIKIIAAMPAYNEEKYVGSMVLNTRQYADAVIVVDDGSSDNTVKIARLAGAEVIEHVTNQGYGAAIQSILAEAKKRQPDVLVILDADAQHNPEEIPNVIKPILENGVEFVIGTRQKQAKKIPFYRRIGQAVILRSVKVLSNDKLTDSECGFRAFSPKAYNTMQLNNKGMGVSAEAVAEASNIKLVVAQVPVSVTYTKDSSTLNPIRHGLGVLASIISMISEQRPMFFFGVGGLVTLIIGIIFGIRALNIYAMNNGILPVGNTLLSVLFLVVGAFSIFTGLILRVLTRVKKN
jgi:glycosyltransferase involved in cell wall biosynthesis